MGGAWARELGSFSVSVKTVLGARAADAVEIQVCRMHRARPVWMGFLGGAGLLAHNGQWLGTPTRSCRGLASVPTDNLSARPPGAPPSSHRTTSPRAHKRSSKTRFSAASSGRDVRKTLLHQLRPARTSTSTALATTAPPVSTYTAREFTTHSRARRDQNPRVRRSPHHGHRRRRQRRPLRLQGRRRRRLREPRPRRRRRALSDLVRTAPP